MILLIVMILCFPSMILAETVTWTCNTEADMKEYRDERSSDGGNTWGVVGVVEHVPGCKTLSLKNPNVVTPGVKLHRIFAIDTSGNESAPSPEVSMTIKAAPIGNPGGQTEPTLPASPYKPNATPPVTPPPPVVTLPPPPPSVKRPSAIKDFTSLSSAEEGSVLIGLIVPDDGTGSPAKVDVRMAPSPIRWGAATTVLCPSFPCLITGVPLGVAQDILAIPFRSTPQGSVFGDFSPVLTVTLTLPPPAPPVTLKDALQSGLDSCLTKGLSHTECMQALREALRKVTQ